MQPGSGEAGKYTIGLLTDFFLINYVTECFNGVVEGIKHHKMNLLCYTGGSLESPIYYNASKNFLYEYVDTSFLSGLIVFSGSLGNYITPEKLKEQCRKFAPLPIISVGTELGGVKNIIIDNKMGILKLMEHLIRVHQCKNIAFIKGPEGNFDARERFEAYKEALEINNIPYNPDLVVKGDFDRAGGSRGIGILLDERTADFDAVMASNDVMAIYAMQALKERGYRIPRDVAVVGFDNTDNANVSFPSLTTVHQPVYNLGKHAVDILHRWLEGEEVPERTVIPAQPVFRQSCGCPGADKFNLAAEISSRSPYIGTMKEELEEVITHQLKEIFPGLSEQTGDPSWPGRWVSLIVMAIENLDDFFWIQLKDRLEKIVQKGIAPPTWYKIVLFIFKGVMKTITDIDEQNRIIEIKDKIIGFLADNANYYESHTRATMKEQFVILKQMNDQLALTNNEEEIRFILKKELQKLNMRDFYIFLFDEKDNGLFKLFFSLRDYTTPNESFEFTAIIREILQEKKEFRYILLPLNYREEKTGIVFFRQVLIDGFVYDEISSQLGYTIKAVKTAAELKLYTGELEKLVEIRTEELMSMQKKLILSAHQAGMAEIASGLFHNIGNILTTLNVSVSEIINQVETSKLSGLNKANNKLSGYKENPSEFISNSSYRDQLIDYYHIIAERLTNEQEKINDEMERIRQRLTMIEEGIEMQRQYASGNFINEKLNVLTVLESTLDFVQRYYFKDQVKVVKNYQTGRRFEITGQKSKLFHIFLNLLKNALEAMRISKPEQMCVELSIDVQPEQLIIRIYDNGSGIRRENLAKIFNYGFSLKGMGRGFGLYTCYNFAREMNGEIRADSKGEGSGACFSLILPT